MSVGSTLPTAIPLQGVNEVAISRNRSGTSISLGGDFALSLGGSRSQYLASNASARDVKLALETLETVGTVDVERYDGDQEVRVTSDHRSPPNDLDLSGQIEC